MRNRLNTVIQRSKTRRDRIRKELDLTYYTRLLDRDEYSVAFHRFTYTADENTVFVSLYHLAPDAPRYEIILVLTEDFPKRKRIEIALDFPQTVHHNTFRSPEHWEQKIVVHTRKGCSRYTHCLDSLDEESETVQKAFSEAFESICAHWFFRGQ